MSDALSDVLYPSLYDSFRPRRPHSIVPGLESRARERNESQPAFALAQGSNYFPTDSFLFLPISLNRFGGIGYVTKRPCL